MQRAVAAMLPDGRRLHLQHGPIDLIAEAWGEGRDAGYARAARRFESVLEELVSELSVLRRYHVGIASVRTPVSRRMVSAVLPFSERFVTPMAAVAGAVADEILAVLAAGPGIARAYANNGGDVALHLGPGERFDAAIAGTGARARIGAADPVRGVATSGWRGRSHSLGIADSVTVLARSAAVADAAATLIANEVDLPAHKGIRRRPASELAPDSDLGDRPVTVDVPPLTGAERGAALAAGLARAEDYRRRGLIEDAYLVLQGESRQTVAAKKPLEDADA